MTKVVRVTYMLPDVPNLRPCWPHVAETVRRPSARATMIECGLIDPSTIEIEVLRFL